MTLGKRPNTLTHQL